MKPPKDAPDAKQQIEVKLDQWDWPARPHPPTCRIMLIRRIGNVIYTKSLRMKMRDIPAFILRRAGRGGHHL